MYVYIVFYYQSLAQGFKVLRNLGNSPFKPSDTFRYVMLGLCHTFTVGLITWLRTATTQEAATINTLSRRILLIIFLLI